MTPEHKALVKRVQRDGERWGCLTIGQLMDKLNEQHDEIVRARIALNGAANYLEALDKLFPDLIAPTVHGLISLKEMAARVRPAFEQSTGGEHAD